MNFQDMLITASQTADAEQPSLFPFPFGLHLIFVCIGVVFFLYRFYVQKRPYQILMAAAIGISMGFWISDSKSLYYGIGIAQLAILLIALISSFIFKAPAENEAVAAADAAVDEEADSEEE